ncbi:hypothetical protein BVRB_7g157330 [Beta vulgaris subsp. vulgaris]|nr:hypothetical protein BVRB_7g157330 [Beta vulgaris subsp. vulgaris]
MAQLRPDFYANSCPHVESIVRNMVQEVMSSDPSIAGGLLRQQYHDCFVNGCDASILLDNSATIRSEKDSITTKFGKNYDVIDKIKYAIEASCPGVVSCADIIALAAESSVSLSGGPSWTVMLGRRDSTTAYQAEANRDLPASFSNFTTLSSKFLNKGLNLTDLVALSGGHTIGVAHCSTIKSRLYNFAPSGSPELNSSYVAKLQEICPQHSNVDRVIGLDLRTPIRFDNSYFINLVQNKGLLISDQDLFSAPDSLTVDLVKIYSSNQKIFFDHFAHSMIKMGNINPLTGDDGEIRSNCRKPNSAN